MAEIEEVPIADAPESVPAEVADKSVAEVPEPAAKKRGRPKGSKNRPRAEPIKAEPERAAAPPPSESRTRRKATSVVAAESEEGKNTPPPRKRRARMEEQSQDSVSPEPPDARVIAAEVLHLLSNRHIERNQAKREKYRSWFH